MLDMALIRSEPQVVATALSRRGVDVDLDHLLGLDAEVRSRQGEVDELRAERNRLSQAIGRAAKAGEDVAEARRRAGEVGDRIAPAEAALAEVKDRIAAIIDALPNLPAGDVPVGGKEANVELRRHLEPPAFGFDPKDHVELAESLRLIDYERGARLGGSGFWVYTGKGALLEWALLNYFVRAHEADGYTFLLVPHILNEAAGYTAGQFPKFADDVFLLDAPDGDDGRRFLLPTAETALVSVHRDETLSPDVLPEKYYAYSPCYRREAGSYRAADRGTLRGHQFNKVEMFQFCLPEQSEAAHDELVAKAEALVQGLGLHHRVSLLAAGDMSASMRRTLDVEVWLPSLDSYIEVSSVSNAGDYQARRARIRYKSAEGSGFVHTLNGSGLATSRLLPAILEQHQQADGSVVVPEPLRQWVGVDVLEPLKH